MLTIALCGVELLAGNFTDARFDIRKAVVILGAARGIRSIGVFAGSCARAVEGPLALTSRAALVICAPEAACLAAALAIRQNLAHVCGAVRGRRTRFYNARLVAVVPLAFAVGLAGLGVGPRAWLAITLFGCGVPKAVRAVTVAKWGRSGRASAVSTRAVLRVPFTVGVSVALAASSMTEDARFFAEAAGLVEGALSVRSAVNRADAAAYLKAGVDGGDPLAIVLLTACNVVNVACACSLANVLRIIP